MEYRSKVNECIELFHKRCRDVTSDNVCRMAVSKCGVGNGVADVDRHENFEDKCKSYKWNGSK